MDHGGEESKDQILPLTLLADCAFVDQGKAPKEAEGSAAALLEAASRGDKRQKTLERLHS